MATYVLSDVHGRLAPLDRALARVSPSDDDRIFVLGDMVDRGPEPVGVLRLVRDLPGSTVLMGNHESLMLDALQRPDDEVARYNWMANGGNVTYDALAALPAEERVDLFEWVAELPLYAHASAGGRPVLLAHAGVRRGAAPVPDEWDEAGREAFLAAQSPQDLLWIREDFWGTPTGLVGADGAGPLIVAGHTPTPLAAPLADHADGPALDEGGRALMLCCGATPATAGVPDRLDIDCACAAGPGVGRVLILCLDDGSACYEDVLDGE